jgi:hypothetical protein
MLATILDFDIKDLASREAWGLAHSRDHQDIRQAIETAGKGNLSDWQLSPVPWKELSAWLIRHQTAHNDFNGAIGTSGSDISSVDFKNEESTKEWLYTHFKEHQAARQTLGI